MIKKKHIRITYLYALLTSKINKVTYISSIMYTMQNRNEEETHTYHIPICIIDKQDQ